MAGLGAVRNDFDFDGLQISFREPRVYPGPGLEIELTCGLNCDIVR
jgi:hypothetical protein